MKRRPPSFDGSPRAITVPLPSAGPPALAQLTDALEILGRRMHEAVAERRAASPGSERWRRADERAERLNGLYLRLQHRMEIPAEIWLLDRPARATRRAPDRGPEPAAAGSHRPLWVGAARVRRG
ncbi:MAG: hypothetical protein K2X91_18050 [Thermoleophilia bacterium]|nr:hypothetical protein [Thermoleophilia bacterium]